MQRAPSGGFVVAATRGLAIERDQARGLWPAFRHPGFETGGKQRRIDAIHDHPQPVLAGVIWWGIQFWSPGSARGLRQPFSIAFTTGTTNARGISPLAAAPASTASSSFPWTCRGASFQLDRLFVEVYEESAADGSEINKVIVPVIFGPRIVAGYYGYRLHTVRRGDTLSRIARDNYGDPNRYPDIVRANPLLISDPDLIFLGHN
jgi:nucleoid-associated protein YgaU